MYEVVKYLTSVIPPRNYKNIDSLNKVSEYLFKQFEFIGLDVNYQEFKVNGVIYKNVIAQLNKNAEKTLVIGAHYDVYGDTQGADDNASAVAGVIETAKELFNVKNRLGFNVEFVCFSLEEPPYFGTEYMGSYVHAKSLKDSNINVIGMINFEMIGYFSNEENTQKYPNELMGLIYPTKGNFIANVGNELSRKFLESFDFSNVKKDIDSYEFVFPDELELLYLSDHMNYWKFGYPSIMVTDTAFLRNPNYHLETDTIDTLDFKKMKDVVNMIVNAIVGLDNV